MRLDKYIKLSRIIKRRTLAKEVAANGRVKINDKVAKPSTAVKVGDIIEIRFGNKIVKIEVTLLSESTKKDDAKFMYKYLSEEKITE